MSYQYEIEAEVTLTPLGVDVISAYIAHLAYVTGPGMKEQTEEDPSWWGAIAVQFPVVAEYAANDRADFIPQGGGHLKPGENYSRLERENVWAFHCCTPDKESEIAAFFKMLPSIASAADITIENDDGIIVEYALVDGVVTETERWNKYAHSYEEYWGPSL